MRLKSPQKQIKDPRVPRRPKETAETGKLIDRPRDTFIVTDGPFAETKELVGGFVIHR